MLANNEVGTIQPIGELVKRIRAHRNVVIHVDAIQAAPYMAIDVRQLDVDLLSIAAHKFEGPKGMGALYIRHGTILLPQTHGGSQERFRRAGTENVAGAVGMAVAFELACSERNEVVPRLASQRDRLRDAVLDVSRHRDDRPSAQAPARAPIRDLPARRTVTRWSARWISRVSPFRPAPHARPARPSRRTFSLRSAIPDDEARGSLRITLGRTTTDAEIEQAALIIPAAIERMRAASTAIARDPLGSRVDA